MAGGFFDTSGLDAQNMYGGTSNNAAADFERLSAQNPSAFGGVGNKKEAQHQALVQSAELPPIPPSPSNPAASPAPREPSRNSSAPGLVTSVLNQIKNPPQYNAQGESLVPGTPFTPQQFAQQLVQQVAQAMPPQPPQYQGPPMNALAPPTQAMQMPPPQQQAGMPAMAPYQGVPQFGATAEGPPQRQPAPPTFGGNTFGGQRFGGNTFGGQRFGQSAQTPPIAPPDLMFNEGAQTPFGPGPMTAEQQLMALARSRGNPNVPPRGYFRGGALRMMRGGYPANLIMGGLPTREAFSTGGGSNAVPSDGMGDGRSDHVDAKLSPGEFVMDAETVALAGNGDSDAGARAMEAIRTTIRKEKGKKLAQGKFSPNAKKPGYYASVAMKSAGRK